jgi:hypothetical protein
MKVIGIASGILAFLMCFGAGAWILFSKGFSLSLDDLQEDPLTVGIAFYFMGKAVFVGAMLIITSIQLGFPGRN